MTVQQQSQPAVPEPTEQDDDRAEPLEGGPTDPNATS